MQCPVCTHVQLVMSERQGIEIDYCPQCRGVWLDRGELDKLIERSAASAAPEGFGRQGAVRHDERPSPPPGRHEYDRDHHKDEYHRRKKKGFLGELFDFD